MTTSHAAPVYRVALVGCGDIAETGHIPSLASHPRFKVIACCDTRAERAELLAARAGGAQTTTDYRTLLNRPDIDAVVLALLPQVSVGVASDFLRAGKPVLDEKPLATNLDDARKLKAVIDSTRGIYQIGFVFSYTDQVRGIAEYVRRIGSPHLIHAAIYDERLDPANTEHFRRIQGALKHSSAMTHEGSHVVDFVKRWNPSPYTRVHAATLRTRADFDGPNLWSAQFSMADGSVLHLEIGWFLPDYRASEIVVHGPGGALRVETATGRGEFISGGKSETVTLPPLVQAWSRQLDAFAEAIDRGVSEACPFSRGWDALRATQACEESARSGRVVELA